MKKKQSTSTPKKNKKISEAELLKKDLQDLQKKNKKFQALKKQVNLDGFDIVDIKKFEKLKQDNEKFKRDLLDYPVSVNEFLEKREKFDEKGKSWEFALFANKDNEKRNIVYVNIEAERPFLVSRLSLLLDRLAHSVQPQKLLNKTI